MAIDINLIRQAAAIPIRGGRICLVTSSSGKRWVIPKGNFEPGKTACEIALQEAWEEAGLTGVLQREPVGSFLYQKYGSSHHVLVFVMHVSEMADNWPEKDVRRRQWLTPGEALERLDDAGLRGIVRAAWRALRQERRKRRKLRSR